VQPAVVVPDSAKTDYEALRRGVLEGSRGDRELGLALLMRRGMAAWIRAWSACAASPTTEGPSRASAMALPAGLRDDVTRLLVTMALRATHTEAHP
jgi:hypothetical protein